MLVRFVRKFGEPEIAEVSYAFYENDCGFFQITGSNSYICIHDIDKVKWATFMGDIFLDGKLSLPYEQYRISIIER